MFEFERKSDYALNVVSHLPEYKNKQMRKYAIDGIDTIGVFGNETFEIQLKNNTREMIQARLSLDGVDILTGELATTNASGKMWVIDPYSSLSLKAYPESTNGGAAFVFTNAENSVALHTTGNMSSRGIIAAAVFTDRQRLRRERDCLTKGVVKTREYCIEDICEREESYDYERSLDFSPDASKGKKGLAAIGAGSYVDQKIRQVAGLADPVLARTLQIKYMWYDDLKAKLEKMNQTSEVSGFPGDKPSKLIDIKGTPRLETSPKGCFRRASSEEYPRF